MPNYRRTRIAGASFFFTVVSFDRRPLLTTPVARDCLRHALRETRARQPFQLDAICLLPEHLHCILTLPEHDMDFSGRWNRIKGLYSKRYLRHGRRPADVVDPPRRRKGEVAVWQRRFWEHSIRDETDFRRHLDCIHFNPVKHGHVMHPADWPWSSLRWYIELGWYDRDWGAQEPESLASADGFGERD